MICGSSAPSPFYGSSDPFAALAVGQWMRAPSVGNYRLSDVAVSPSPGGNSDYHAVMAAWGSACFDSARRDLLVWGGGHADYWGNEVYAFDVDNFVWRRKTTASSTSSNVGIETLADGTPSSRHTYSTLVYAPVQDAMLSMPGGAPQATSGFFTEATWQFDCSTETPNSTGAGKWTRKDDAPVISPDTNPNPFPMGALNPTDGLVYVQHRWGFASYDPATGHYTAQTTFESPNAAQASTCAVANLAGTQKFLRLGSDGTNSVTTCRDLDGVNFTFTGSENAMGVTGATNIQTVQGPGFGWEPNLQRMVAWAGTLTGGTDNRDYYTLNIGTKVWTRNAGSGDIPDNPQADGTWGRFQYIGGGIWVLVNSADSNVYFLRTS